MDIIVVNIENKNEVGITWNFRSRFGAKLMLRALFRKIGATPVHNYYDEEKLIVVGLNNAHVQKIIDNTPDNFFMRPFLRDMELLKTGQMVSA